MNSFQKKVDGFVARLCEPSDFSYYLSIFRVYVGIHLLKKYILIWPYLGLLYSENSYVEWTKYYIFEIPNTLIRQNYLILAGLILACSVLLIFGLFSRFAFIITFLCLDALHRTNGFILNGGDSLLKIMLLYMIFCDTDRHLSLRKSPSAPGPISNAATNLVLLTAKMHLCAIFFTSAVAKNAATVWCNGTAVYYCFMLERFQGTPWNAILVQNEYFVMLATYGTLLIEIALPFLIWWDRTKMWVILGAVALHIGIYIFMMIYDFEIMFIAMYGFWITNLEWSKWLQKAPIDWLRCQAESITASINGRSPSTR